MRREEQTIEESILRAGAIVLFPEVNRPVLLNPADLRY